jgi:predicted dehydrogenase
MKSKLKLAIVGGGINSAVGEAHISALLLTNLYQITTVFFSRDFQLNELSRTKYNLTESYICFNIEDLIAQKKNYDFVIVLTPTDTHFEILMPLINENIHIICEKALVSSLGQAYDLKKALSNSTSKLFVIYNYLGYSMIKALKKIVNNGNLGEISNIQIEMPQEGFARVKNNKPISIQPWRLEDDFIPTLSLDLGVHLHILIHYLFDIKPENVFARYNFTGNYKQIVSDVNAIITYENSVVCNMWFSKIALGYLNGLKIRIFGALASAEWIQAEPDKLYIANSLGDKQIIDKNNNIIQDLNINHYERFKPGHPTGFVEALTNYYSDIWKSFKGFESCENKEVFGIEESIEGIELFNLFSESVRQGKMLNFTR